MSKIIGVTVGTPISARKIEDELKPVKSVSGRYPDKDGDVDIDGVIEDALTQAKASGKFDGQDGHSIHYVDCTLDSANPDGYFEIPMSVDDARVSDMILLPDQYIYRISGFSGTDKALCVQLFSIEGDDGKSAYAYAKDAGYTGTEAQFAQKLAKEIPTTLPASDVYSWAKQPNKPTYTAAEVGAATESYVDAKIAGVGGVDFTAGNAMELKNGVLNVVTTDEMSGSNTLPITSKGVYAVVGDINTLLSQI